MHAYDRSEKFCTKSVYLDGAVVVANQFKRYDCRFLNCIKEAQGSAVTLVNLLVSSFPCFRDEGHFEGRLVRFYKRAQILVADLWAAFEGEGYGRFDDIDKITMFAGSLSVLVPVPSFQDVEEIKTDYRIPQMLYSLGCLRYSPSLDYQIQQLRQIEGGHPWEIQLRGCSIWCVELLKRHILLLEPTASVNAILIDFFLYDTMKARETDGASKHPHHRTRSIWY